METIIECSHCRRPFEVTEGVGRPRKYCRRSCRQRAFEARRHEGDLAWGDARLIRMARRLAELEDHLDELDAVASELHAEVEDHPSLSAGMVLGRFREVRSRGPSASV